MKRLSVFVLLSMIAAVSATGSAHAETLLEAMVNAYNTSPVLQAEQARLRAAVEQIPLAKAGARPTADLNADAGAQRFEQFGVKSENLPRSVGISVSQPLYRGGRIQASIGSAEKAALAQRARYQAAEQQLLLDVTTAYLDTFRDQAVLKLNRKNEDVLRQELTAARDRFQVGEATRTDVAQAESRFSGATAARIQSEGNLAISRSTYARIIGHEPADLSPVTPNVAIPNALDAMVTQAGEKSPQVVAAKYNSLSADEDVDVAAGSLLPELSLQAGASRAWDTSPSLATDEHADTATIGARLTVPLYRAGGDYAGTRAAKQTASQRRVETHQAVRQAREGAVRAWETLQTSKATIKARRKQVEAAELAFEGVKQESLVGTRTILDRLDAEAEALQARVNLVQAERDESVALFQVKAAIGELTAARMALPVQKYYNPDTYFEENADSWIGLGDSIPEPPVDEPSPAATSALIPTVTITPETESAPAADPAELPRDMGFEQPEGATKP
jgi:TolC family type I secretion outer membrane protein